MVLGLTLALTACGAGEGEDETGPGAVDPTGPLVALPECASTPPAFDEEVAGLILPPGSVVTGITRQDPLVTVSAFVPLTPVQFERAYPAIEGLEVLITENEIYEAELLISDGTHRNFLKATASCSTGSQVTAVVAPELDAEGLPVPQQATATPSP